jgi:dipeptidase
MYIFLFCKYFWAKNIYLSPKNKVMIQQKTILIATLLLCPFVKGNACTNLIITKGASADGSVMVSYSADSHTRFGTLVHYPAKKYPEGQMLKIYEWGKGRYLGEIAQVKETYEVIGNMNEYQVVIGETTWGGIKSQYDPEGIVDYGSLMYICLQRAKTAREAIKIFTDLTAQYGYASTGESISIADPNEAWILEIIGKAPKKVNGVNVNKGAVWVAVKIPDGCISGHANQARITTFPLNDPENCVYSPDVITHAREQGLYEGKDEDFSFADTYGPADAGTIRSCDARIWCFFKKYGADNMDNYLDYVFGKNISHRIPLYIKAKSKLSVKDVAFMMRDHYEGTPLDMTNDIGAGGNSLPYRWRPMDWEIDGVNCFNERAIATQQTGFWFIGQCRSYMPKEIGGIFWFAVDDAGTSPLTPVYTSSRAISQHYAEGNGSMIEYSDESMFWIVNRIAQFAYLRYNHIGAEVQQVITKHEEKCFEEVAALDNRLLAMIAGKPSTAVNAGKSPMSINTGKSSRSEKLDTEAISMITTEFSVSKADSLFHQWKALDKYLLVKYIDGNTKKQNPDGSFMNNGYNNNIPPSPDFPGYTDLWKRAVKENAGAKLTL